VTSEEIAKLEARLERAEGALAIALERIAELEAENAALRGETGKSSRNSGQPPSSDSPAQRNERPKSAPSGKKPGGQPGHKGHERTRIPAEQVTESRDLFPKRCRRCHRHLQCVSLGEPLVHQTVELPKIVPLVYEYLLHAVACECGTVTRAPLPRGVPRGMCGPNLVAVLTLLVGVFQMSRRDAVALASDVLGVRISLGALSKIEGQVAEMLEPAHTEAATLVKRARAKYVDATSWLRKAAGRTLWVIGTRLATVFHIVEDGTADRLKGLVGTLGILITDRGSQFGFWAMERRQVCWAHLLRKFVSFTEHPDARVAKTGEHLLLLSHALLGAWHNVRDETMSRAAFQDLVARMRPHFEGHLARMVEFRLVGPSGSCANMLEHADALWTFASVVGVEPTNNHAERELRRFVMWRKTCLGSQSQRGDDFAARVMTVVHTLRKQDRHVLSFLRDTIAASLHGTPRPSLMPVGP
jgi:transposase